MPMPPHAVQSMAMARVAGRAVRKLDTNFAEQVVGGAVIRLSCVAEPARNRAECHGGPEGDVRYGREKVEPAVRFDVKHQVEFARLLIRQEMGAFHTRGVQQNVHAPAAVAHLADGFGHRDGGR